MGSRFARPIGGRGSQLDPELSCFASERWKGVVLIPSFSIRQLLMATIVFASVSALLGFAYRGSLVAFGLGFAILALIIPALVFSGIYLLGRLGLSRVEAPPEFHSPTFGPDELTK